MRLHTYFSAVAAGSLLALAAPALSQTAHDHAGADYATDAEGRVYGDAMPGMPSMPSEGTGYNHAMGNPEMDAQRAAWEEDRADWLDECRARMDDGRYRRRGRDRDHGLGGALIGAATGGLAGNLIGGRGNRTEGTVLGALAGAAVGTVIDRSRAMMGIPAPSNADRQAFAPELSNAGAAATAGAATIASSILTITPAARPWAIRAIRCR
jgi:Glycine zipper 2TM domain